MSTESTVIENEPWWGEIPVKIGEAHRWSINDRDIIIRREPHEWRIWDRQKGYPSSAIKINRSVISDKQFSEAIDISCPSLSRYIQNQTSDSLCVLPALADRAIVARPATPLCILPGETVMLYVSTPLWFTAKLSGNSTTIIDIPFWRPSDSWFGISTREGEMCYAKYTDARLDLEGIESQQHKAITPVQVINNSSDKLAFERVNIPVPLLTLYANDQFFLWTNRITLKRGSEKTTVEIAQTPPAEFTKKSDPVNVARQPLEKKTFIHSLSSLFA